MDSAIYLAKGEKINGPFSRSEFKRMQSSGALLEFHWLWSETKRDWEPIHSKPAPIVEKRVVKGQKLKAFCQKGNILSNGDVSEVSQVGFLFTGKITKSFHSPGSVVQMGFFNRDSGKTVRISAKVLGVKKTRKQFSYQMKWTHPKRAEVAFDGLFR